MLYGYKYRVCFHIASISEAGMCSTGRNMEKGCTKIVPKTRQLAKNICTTHRYAILVKNSFKNGKYLETSEVDSYIL
jgi:hypothetical protein